MPGVKKNTTKGIARLQPNGEIWWDVERIISHRIDRNRGILFRTKWANCDSDENTSEPASQFLGTTAEPILREYCEKHRILIRDTAASSSGRPAVPAKPTNSGDPELLSEEDDELSSSEEEEESDTPAIKKSVEKATKGKQKAKA